MAQGNAASTLTLKSYPSGLDQTQRRTIATGTIAIEASAKTYGSPGVPISWVGLFEGGSDQYIADGGFAPVEVTFHSVTGSGFLYFYNATDSTIQIFVTGASSGAVLAELADGAVPAGVSGDTIQFRAEFIRNRIV